MESVPNRKRGWVDDREAERLGNEDGDVRKDIEQDDEKKR